jgi:K+-transporting ATPase ATPase C chain
MTGVSQVVFHDKANGSLIERGGKVVGSKLLAQPAMTPGGRRRSAVLPAAAVANRLRTRPRPSSPTAAPTTLPPGPSTAAARAYLRLERPYTPGLTAAGVPVDAVTTSGSGVDPHISEANARIQANRVARVRHCRSLASTSS